MYQFAYSATFEEPPSRSLPQQTRKLLDAIELIEAAEEARFPAHELLQILSDFRQLWLSIVEDLSHEAGDLPNASQANVQSLAYGVLQEIERQRFQRKVARPEIPSGRGAERLI
jgi:flagellar biosynthesis regulator FlaF